MRRVTGPTLVARVEELVYGAEDVVLTTVDAVSPTTPTSIASGPALAEAAPSAVPASDRPSGSSAWQLAHDASRSAGHPIWSAIVEPDRRRPRAMVRVLAFDTRHFRLEFVAGTEEPDDDRIPRSARTGRVPDDMIPRTVMVASGGFRSVHGPYAMRVGRHTFHAPRRRACTVATDPTGTAVIDTWRDDFDGDAFAGYRQAPPCLLQDAVLGAGILLDDHPLWGTSVSGTTIIRRSGLGVSADGLWLFYAIGDHLSTRSLATALAEAGASDAIQLDVNSAPTRALWVDTSTDGPALRPVVRGLVFEEGMYVRRPWFRDFIVVARR